MAFFKSFWVFTSKDWKSLTQQVLGFPPHFFSGLARSSPDPPPHGRCNPWVGCRQHLFPASQLGTCNIFLYQLKIQPGSSVVPASFSQTAVIPKVTSTQECFCLFFVTSISLYCFEQSGLHPLLLPGSPRCGVLHRAIACKF